MSIIENRFIKKKEFSKLLFNMLDGMDTHSLSMWLKSKTDEEWVVMPRDYIFTLIVLFEEGLKKNAERLDITSTLEELEDLKKYL
jgi:hypothetical protein